MTHVVSYFKVFYGPILQDRCDLYNTIRRLIVPKPFESHLSPTSLWHFIVVGGPKIISEKFSALLDPVALPSVLHHFHLCIYPWVHSTQTRYPTSYVKVVREEYHHKVCLTIPSKEAFVHSNTEQLHFHHKRVYLCMYVCIYKCLGHHRYLFPFL